MTATKANPIVRLFPSLTDFAFVLPLLFLFGMSSGATHLLSDADTGWHIRTGEWILANGRVPTVDLFSFTKPGQPWFAWEWLWDVIFAGMHMRWGLTAVVFVSALILCLTSVLLFRLITQRCENRFVAIAITAMAMGGSAMHWLARPHLFTLFFVVVFLHILERARAGRTRLIWICVPLTILWTNLHGGFFVGLFLIAVYGTGDIVGALLHGERKDVTMAVRRAIPYVVCTLICAAATLVNPYGYGLHVHIYKYLSGEGYHFQVVSEFQSLDFHNPMSRFFEPLIVLGALAGVWALVRHEYTYVISIAVWLHLALISVRNVPIFLLIAAPVIARAVSVFEPVVLQARLSQWLRAFLNGTREIAIEFSEMDGRPRVHLVSVAVVAALLVALAYSEPKSKFWCDFDRTQYPVGALVYLGGTGAPANLFADDEWGDYLIYRLYPYHRVFADGRTDFYGADMGKNLNRILGAKYDWNERLARYGAQMLILHADSALATVAKRSSDWRLAYDDGTAVVFRNTHASQSDTVSVLTNGERHSPNAMTRSKQGGSTVAQLLKER